MNDDVFVLFIYVFIYNSEQRVRLRSPDTHTSKLEERVGLEPVSHKK
jgi:hypothetical protein